MINEGQVRDIVGCEVRTVDGEKVGRVAQVYLDDQSGQPEWVTVQTGLFGTKETFVPLGQADWGDDAIAVPYAKSTIKNAPRVDVDQGHLPQSEENDLYRYYGLDYQASANEETYAAGLDATAAEQRARGTAGTSATSESGVGSEAETSRRDDDAMTRSEERLNAGKEQVVTGRAKLRKWVETEDVTVSVPVRKEKARLEREPITGENVDEAMQGPDLTDADHEVTLTEERAVVEKETVPVERVRLTKDVEETEQRVSEQLQKERIAAEGDVSSDAR